jgi:hypothetical protein
MVRNLPVHTVKAVVGLSAMYALLVDSLRRGLVASVGAKQLR